MKIGNSPEVATTAVGTDKPGAARGSASSSAAGAAGGAKKVPEASAQIELSSAAANLLAGDDDGSFDVEKVNRISQAISEGKFTVNAEAIADKLISNAKELLSPKPSSH